MSEQPKAGRRSFLAALATLGAVAVGAILAVPGVAYLVDPLVRRRKGEGNWYPVGPVTAIPDDRPVALPVVGEQIDAWTRAPAQRLGTVWVQKKAGGQLQTFSAECTHLGCRIGYDEERERFNCPCHDAVFSKTGEVLQGPPPRGMDPIDTRVVDGIVEVQFKRFRTQKKERIEIASAEGTQHERCRHHHDEEMG